jgi:hypothetical protein
MFFKITLLIIILVLFYLILDYSTKVEQFTSNQTFKPKDNAIQNFIAYPDKQPFCASLHSSKSKYWSKLPSKYCKGLHVKYCCTGCYYKICKSITCSENKKGLYKVSKLSSIDIKKLKEYYDKKNSKNNNKKLDFKFNEKKLKKLKGKYVLKYRHYNVYYPIQVLKYEKDMDRFDIVMKKVIKKEYRCKK